MQISDDNLIAYLLGDAPADLVSEIERQLALDQSLVSRLGHLRMVLGQVDSLYGVYEPPSDLIESTFSRIDASLAEPETKLGSFNPFGKNRVSLWDSAVLTISLILLCCMILPAVVRARFVSRKLQCANNMRFIGNGLFDFAMNDPQQRLPRVDLDGRGGFAGIYAVRLKTYGFPVTHSQLQCPSLLGLEPEAASVLLPMIPTLAEVQELAFGELEFFQRAVGGDYAYNLGVYENKRVMAPKYQSRPQFAILADSPIIRHQQELLNAHDGRGINILYEDGRVFFVPAPSIFSYDVLDHPFRNASGIHAHGLTPQDSSLAPSHFSPLGRFSPKPL